MSSSSSSKSKIRRNVARLDDGTSIALYRIGDVIDFVWTTPDNDKFSTRMSPQEARHLAYVLRDVSGRTSG